jgi:hypothetical protein
MRERAEELVLGSTGTGDADRPFVKFPQQPVHPRLTERLYLETERLRRHPKYATLPLPDNIDLNVVAAALRGLEGKGTPKRCLDPWRASELEALLTEGVRLVRYCWKQYALSPLWKHCKAREQGKTQPVLVSTETLLGDWWMPRVELHDGYSSGCIYRDILRSDLGQSMLRYFIKGRRASVGHAAVLVLDYLSGEMLPDIHQAVKRMGYTLPSYDALRKWVAREREKLKPRLREECSRWGIVPPGSRSARLSPETSREVSGDVVFADPNPYFAATLRMSLLASTRTLKQRRQHPVLASGKRRDKQNAMKRTRKPIAIGVPTQVDLLRRSSPLARAAFVRGNAAGVHGGTKPRYGKRERQAARREEREATRTFRGDFRPVPTEPRSTH